MTDNGLAALVEALHLIRHMHGDLWPPTDACGCKDEAAAILGPRGVFLPDGLPPLAVLKINGNATAKQVEAIRAIWTDLNAEQAATIATLREQNDGLYAAVQMGAREQDRLRAALDGLVEAGEAYIVAVDADLYRPGTPEDWWNREAALAALRAALATAKEAGG
jgi:hypothetical protein